MSISRPTIEATTRDGRAVPGRLVGIDFETETGVLLAGHTTTDDGIVTGTVTGPGYVDCVVDRLPFNPGVLLVSVGITDEHEMHTYDHLYQGECGDAEVVAEVAANYRRLVDSWRKARMACRESVSSA